jgi:hypothetical protein
MLRAGAQLCCFNSNAFASGGGVSRTPAVSRATSTIGTSMRTTLSTQKHGAMPVRERRWSHFLGAYSLRYSVFGFRDSPYQRVSEEKVRAEVLFVGVEAPHCKRRQFARPQLCDASMDRRRVAAQNVQIFARTGAWNPPVQLAPATWTLACYVAVQPRGVASPLAARLA